MNGKFLNEENYNQYLEVRLNAHLCCKFHAHITKKNNVIMD